MRALHTLDRVMVSGVNHALLTMRLSDTSQLPEAWTDAMKVPNSELGTNKATKYMPKVSSMEEARNVMKTWTLPPSVQAEARKNARKLVGLMVANGAPMTLRRQTSGRLDMGRVARTYDDLMTGRLSDDEARVYKRRVMGAPKRPHIGIVGDGSWSQMWKDEAFVPRVSALCLGVMWAAEAMGFTVTAALTQDWFTRKQPMGGPLTCGYEICSQGRPAKFRDLGPLYSRDMYRLAYWAGAAASPSFLTDVKWTGSQDFEGIAGMISGSYDGGHGVTWARNKGADFVIAIGAITDKAQAEIALELTKHTSLDETFDKIAAAIKARR